MNGAGTLAAPSGGHCPEQLVTLPAVMWVPCPAWPAQGIGSRMTRVPGRIFIWQRIGQRADGAFEIGQVFVNGGLQV